MNEEQIKEAMRLADTIRTAHAADWDDSETGVEASTQTPKGGDS